MRRGVVRLLNYLIWLLEGNSWAYYRKRAEVFSRFTVPRMVYQFRSRFGMVRRYSFNTISASVMWDGEKLGLAAIEQEREDRRIKNHRRAKLQIEAYARDNRFRKMADLRGMDTLAQDVRLSREERANARF